MNILNCIPLNLADITAQKTYPDSTALLVSVILIVTGIILVIAMIKFGKASDHKYTVMSFRRPRIIPIIGFAFVIIGLLAILASYFVFGKVFWSYPEKLTESYMEKLSKDLNVLVLANDDNYLLDNPPTEIGEALRILYKSEFFTDEMYQITDVWDTQFQIKPVEYEGSLIMILRSAGEDMQFDTSDDIVYPGNNSYAEFTKKILQYFKHEKFHVSKSEDSSENQTQESD